MERQSEAEPERASGQAPVAGHERVADRGPAPALKPEAERIVVVGTSGSGKTTLARDLARRLGFSHIELDALNWEADWVTAPNDVFVARVTAAAAQPRWVADGNYSRARHVLWPRADTVIWVDYPLPIILWRLLRRTLRRTLGREVLWNGNRERFATQFFSRDSLFVWVWRSYRRRRRQYPELFARPEFRHLHVIRLRSPRETERWLRSVRRRLPEQ